MIYDFYGNSLKSVYGIENNILLQACNINGQKLIQGTSAGYVYESAVSEVQTYAGGFIEIQPDSWDGSTAVLGDIIENTDETAWGFPMSLSEDSFTSIKNEILCGNGLGISYIRFPLGFAYRGYRNIDETTGLAKNIGERWEGQNESLKKFFANIAEAGGGLAPEYWCLAPYWTTGGAYYNANVANEVWAGGSYSRTTSLESIRTSDVAQYKTQLELISNAIMDDLAYIHTNICPVRLFGLANEPWQNGQKYGTCKISKQIYIDLMEILVEKIRENQILTSWNDKDNNILFYDNDGYCGTSDYLWGHAISHSYTRTISGEYGVGADWYKTASLKENSFLNEYEYWTVNRTDEFMFANNALRMIFEFVYSKSRIVHPVIHICKPTGQTSSDTNTKGYCMYAVDMLDGSYTVNTWVYNSWKLLNDNLPIGAVYKSGGDGGLTGAGYVIFSYNGKKYVLMANNTSESKELILTFDSTLSLDGKQYSITELGTELDSLSGNNVTFSIPAYTAQCWKES